MLHDAIWALRLGELNNDLFPQDIYEKVALSADFLLQILDPVSGNVPNHGANDSALVLPLNDADPRIFARSFKLPIILSIASDFLMALMKIFSGYSEPKHRKFPRR